MSRSPALVLATSLPGFDYPAGSLALPALHAQLPGRGGSDCRARARHILRNGAALVLKFGPLIARTLRQRRPRPSDRWHLDVMVARIAGKRTDLRRASHRARHYSVRRRLLTDGGAVQCALCPVARSAFSRRRAFLPQERPTRLEGREQFELLPPLQPSHYRDINQPCATKKFFQYGVGQTPVHSVVGDSSANFAAVCEGEAPRPRSC